VHGISQEQMETRARARAEREAENKEEQDSGYLSIVLTNQEKDLVRTIQRRDPASRSQLNWKEAAESVGLREEYLKALCMLPMPLFSNNVPPTRPFGVFLWNLRWKQEDFRFCRWRGRLRRGIKKDISIQSK
jgi:hypothetical protein